MKKGIIAAIIAILAIALIAFFVMSNKDDETTSTTNDTSQSSSDTSNNEGEGPAANTGEGGAVENVSAINIKDSGFEFEDVKVKKGTTITWTNNGDLPHNVVSEEDGGPKSETLQPGDTYSFTFNDVGTFNYICTFHPSMTGKVTVTE